MVRGGEEGFGWGVILILRKMCTVCCSGNIYKIPTRTAVRNHIETVLRESYRHFLAQNKYKTVRD